MSDSKAVADTPDTHYYAIGDIHGLADRLATLHALILADIAEHGSPCHIVHLGDYVDRGPDSRGVIERLRAFEMAMQGSRVRVSNLMGNHEAMLLDALAGDREALRLWLGNGGTEAVASYSRASLTGFPQCIDEEHRDWLSALPDMVRGARGLVFVHAGIEPAIFPLDDLEQRLWTRSKRFFQDENWPARSQLSGIRVVHGHTPTATLEPYESSRRINLDTGAVFGGPLTCAVIAPDAPVRYLTA